jgi:hypothetical protein
MTLPSSEPAHTAGKQDNKGGFSLVVLGWIFSLCTIVLIVCMIALCIMVVKTMTEESPVVKPLVDQFVKGIASRAARPPTPVGNGAAAKEKGSANADVGDDDQSTVQLAIMLEYANADIRAGNIQVVVALGAGLFLSIIGMLLFASQIFGDIAVSGSNIDAKMRLVTSSPGIVAVMIGGLLIGCGVMKNLSRPFSESIRKPNGTSLQEKEVHPPGPKPEGQDGVPSTMP